MHFGNLQWFFSDSVFMLLFVLTGWPSHVMACQIPDSLFSDPVAEQRSHSGNWALQNTLILWSQFPHTSTEATVLWSSEFFSLCQFRCVLSQYFTLEIFWEHILYACITFWKIIDIADIAFTWIMLLEMRFPVIIWDLSVLYKLKVPFKS